MRALCVLGVMILVTCMYQAWGCKHVLFACMHPPFAALGDPVAQEGQVGQATRHAAALHLRLRPPCPLPSSCCSSSNVGGSWSGCATGCSASVRTQQLGRTWLSIVGQSRSSRRWAGGELQQLGRTTRLGHSPAPPWGTAEAGQASRARGSRSALQRAAHTPIHSRPAGRAAQGGWRGKRQ
jgi:hypothetical protein